LYFYNSYVIIRYVSGVERCSPRERISPEDALPLKTGDQQVSETAKDAGVLFLIGVSDLNSAIGVVLRFSQLLVHSALCGIAALLAWMSFVAADYSRRDSLIIFGCAVILFIIGIQPVADSRLLNSGRS
jgi:hypothetical protein